MGLRSWIALVLHGSAVRPSRGVKQGESRGELIHGSGSDHRGHLAGVVGGGRGSYVGGGHGQIRTA